MFGDRAKEALGERISGSYNLFLGADNELRLANASSLPASVLVTVVSPAGRTSAGIPAAPYHASGLSIGDSTFFGRRAGAAVARRS